MHFYFILGFTSKLHNFDFIFNILDRNTFANLLLQLQPDPIKGFLFLGATFVEESVTHLSGCNETGRKIRRCTQIYATDLAERFCMWYLLSKDELCWVYTCGGNKKSPRFCLPV